MERRGSRQFVGTFQSWLPVLLCCFTVVEGIHLRRPKAALEESLVAQRNTSALKPYVLLGPEDTGTNLLEQLIEANWPNTFVSSQAVHAVWKHSNSGAEDIYRVIRSSGFGNISGLPAVAIVRSPMSQVASWMKAPYDLAECVKRPVTEMDSPCIADLGARPAGDRSLVDIDASDVHPILYSSVMDVYNKYLQQYSDIASDAVFAKFLQLSYEDVVYSPEAVVQLLASLLGVTAPNEVVMVEEPAKSFSSSSREEALERLHNHTYLQDLGDVGLQTLCPLLNTTLLSNLQEGSFLSEELGRTLSYMADCVGFLGESS
mmetsp:Transcript_23761/g.55368  ORF Transcript_23761/g.55368 Transcript_23761/m.55368 type:complete len:317 (+) Transcript_23761:80-1030(+)